MKQPFPTGMDAKLTRREIIAGVAMLSAAGIAAARKPDIPVDYLGKHKLDEVIPEQIGKWKFVTTSGVVVPPKDQLQLALYSQLLTRVYTDGDVPVMLLAAYSATQSGFLQVHRPEFCYTAAGFDLSNFAPHEITLAPDRAIRVNTLSATREGSGEKLLYWVRIGEHIPLSWAQQKFVFAEDNLRRLIPDSILVRVSTPLVDEAVAMATIDRFVRDMVAATPPSLRRVLIG
jgi:EpsI family protein